MEYLMTSASTSDRHAPGMASSTNTTANGSMMMFPPSLATSVYSVTSVMDELVDTPILSVTPTKYMDSFGVSHTTRTRRSMSTPATTRAATGGGASADSDATLVFDEVMRVLNGCLQHVHSKGVQGLQYNSVVRAMSALSHTCLQCLDRLANSAAATTSMPIKWHKTREIINALQARAVELKRTLKQAMAAAAAAGTANDKNGTGGNGGGGGNNADHTQRALDRLGRSISYSIFDDAANFVAEQRERQVIQEHAMYAPVTETSEQERERLSERYDAEPFPRLVRRSPVHSALWSYACALTDVEQRHPFALRVSEFCADTIHNYMQQQQQQHARHPTGVTTRQLVKYIYAFIEHHSAVCALLCGARDDMSQSVLVRRRGSTGNVAADITPFASPAPSPKHRTNKQHKNQATAAAAAAAANGTSSNGETRVSRTLRSVIRATLPEVKSIMYACIEQRTLSELYLHLLAWCNRTDAVQLSDSRTHYALTVSPGPLCTPEQAGVPGFFCLPPHNNNNNSSNNGDDDDDEKQPPPYAEVILLLQRMGTCFHWRRKLELLVQACRAVPAAVTHHYHDVVDAGELNITSDELIPILAYAVFRAQVPIMAAQLQFMNECSEVDSKLALGEEGYCLTTLHCVLDYIGSHFAQPTTATSTTAVSDDATTPTTGIASSPVGGTGDVLLSDVDVEEDDIMMSMSPIIAAAATDHRRNDDNNNNGDDEDVDDDDQEEADNDSGVVYIESPLIIAKRAVPASRTNDSLNDHNNNDGGGGRRTSLLTTSLAAAAAATTATGSSTDNNNSQRTRLPPPLVLNQSASSAITITNKTTNHHTDSSITMSQHDFHPSLGSPMVADCVGSATDLLLRPSRVRRTRTHTTMTTNAATPLVPSSRTRSASSASSTSTTTSGGVGGAGVLVQPPRVRVPVGLPATLYARLVEECVQQLLALVADTSCWQHDHNIGNDIQVYKRVSTPAPEYFAAAETLVMGKRDPSATHIRRMTNASLPASDVQCVMGRGIIRAAPENVCAVLREAHNRANYDSMCESAELVERIDENTHVVHLKFAAKRFCTTSYRDFVVLVHWRQLHNGTNIITGRSVKHPSCPELGGRYTRGKIVFSGWLLEACLPSSSSSSSSTTNGDAVALDGGDTNEEQEQEQDDAMVHTKTSYVVQVDVGGLAPLWIKNLVANKQPLLIRNVSELFL